LEWSLTHFLPEAPKRCHEDVLQRRLVDPDLVDANPAFTHCFFNGAFGLVGLAYEKIQAIAESLNVYDYLIGPTDPGENSLGFRKVGDAKLEALRIQVRSQFAGRSELLNP